MSDARLTEIEIALTHQEAATEDLSEAVRLQAARIDRLERLVDALTLRLVEAETGSGAPPEPDARPPHW